MKVDKINGYVSIFDLRIGVLSCRVTNSLSSNSTSQQYHGAKLYQTSDPMTKPNMENMGKSNFNPDHLLAERLFYEYISCKESELFSSRI